MKLAKKMLACAIALAMVAAIAVTAFAAAPSLKVTYTTEGTDKVTVTIGAVDMAGLQGGNIIVKYDPTVLEFIPAAEDNVAASTAFIAVGGIPQGNTAEDGILSASLMFMGAATADMDLVVFSFKVLKAENAKITVSTEAWDGVEGNPASTEKLIGLAAPTTAAPTTAAPTTAAPTTAAPTTAAPTTAAPVVEDGSVESTTAADAIPPLGDAGVAAVAGVMALAAVAFVVTRKKDAE